MKDSTSKGPIFFAFHTRDDPYEEMAQQLVDSLNKLGLDWHLATGKPGVWLDVVRTKPQKLLDFYSKANRAVVFIDVDSVVNRWPEELMCIEEDVAVVRSLQKPYGFQAGLTFWNRTPAARDALQEWADITNTAPPEWNETKTLNIALETCAATIKELPSEYLAITHPRTGEDRPKNPVITTELASRVVFKDKPTLMGEFR